MKSSVQYRCVASTPAGFVQQLAVSYIGHGYWFYVTGVIPQRKDPALTDKKLIERYGIGISKWARARRKRAGLSNVHYLRFEKFFVILASKGEHRFFEDEKAFRDVRRDSLRFQDYSIGYKRDVKGDWHPSVRIHPEPYQDLKAYLVAIAGMRTVQDLAREFTALAFEPYAPVRTQLLSLLRAVNGARATAGLDPVPKHVLRLRRNPTVVFKRD